MNVTKEDIKLYAPELTLTRHTGFILAWSQHEYTYRGNPEILKAKVKTITIKNLLTGWWSPLSVVINPVVTIINWVNFFQYKKNFLHFMSSPERYIAEAKEASHISSGKADKTEKRAIKFLWILVVTLVVIVVWGLVTTS